MNPEDVRKYRNKPVLYNGSRYILRAARIYTDSTGVLQDCEAEAPTWTKNFPKKKSNKERQDDRKESLETAFSALEEDGKCTVNELAEYLGVTEKTVRNHLKEHGGFWTEDGECGYKKEGKSR